MSGYTRAMAVEDSSEYAIAKWEAEEAVKAEASYSNDEDKRYCPACGQLLRYNSMSYDEGFHFDSCY